jgi:hypothetical protein
LLAMTHIILPDRTAFCCLLVGGERFSTD